ncbi:TonB family protein [Thauera aromatica]|uniref:energy transducer TonB n=1 Tax=Thauera aromatica TaxID=59405 RepID=UPI001FFDB98F|nr:TonB family protein [Thauera aromatica]MCK2087205.1 TonB family protein [Thauera aromatica]MCK2126948.1 TonB family protein [Thauera aromatica]
MERAADPQFATAARAAQGRSGGRCPHPRGRALLLSAFALSLALHGLLLSVRFRLPEAAAVRDRGLEVVLVNARHARPAEKAEVLAQANIDGGGRSAQDARPSTPLPPQPARRNGDALAEARRRAPESARTPKPALTRDTAAARVATAPKRSEPPPLPVAEPKPAVSGLDLLDSAAAVARLEATIDHSLQDLAKLPRKKFIGSRAQEYRFARYLEDWRLKVERVGALNYPEAARGKLYGNLLLSVTIRADGSVGEVHVQRSSGHKVLDDAAVRIVRLAAPYAAFPPDIRKDYELLEITRTWSFTGSDQLRAN